MIHNDEWWELQGTAKWAIQDKIGRLRSRRNWVMSSHQGQVIWWLNSRVYQPPFTATATVTATVTPELPEVSLSSLLHHFYSAIVDNLTLPFSLLYFFFLESYTSLNSLLLVLVSQSV
jgi:hypothetical protein